jgi:hypothetical protein
LRAEIAQTRAELGETVEALAAKTDVKARTAALKARAADAVRGPAVRRSVAPAAAAAALATGVLLVVRGRKR